MTVLVVADEAAALRRIARAFAAAGFETVVARTPQAALVAAASADRELVVIDSCVDGLPARDLCRALRHSAPSLPLLALVREGRVQERVGALEAGADDCLATTFDPAELLARARALLRRHRRERSHAGNVGSVVLERRTRRLRHDGRCVDLSSTEALLMEQFLLNPGELLTRETLYVRVWGSVPARETNLLGVYVGYLRRKLQATGIQASVRTVRGVGYVFELGHMKSVVD